MAREPLDPTTPFVVTRVVFHRVPDVWDVLREHVGKVFVVIYVISAASHHPRVAVASTLQKLVRLDRFCRNRERKKNYGVFK